MAAAHPTTPERFLLDLFPAGDIRAKARALRCVQRVRKIDVLAMVLVVVLTVCGRGRQPVAEIKRRLQQASGPVSIEEVQAWRIELRRSLRDAESRPIIDQIDAWWQSTRSLEGTALHEAIAHLDRIWDRLILVLDDPRIPLDNGHAERQQRGPVIGRKNFYGCRSEMGARVAALMFSLILSARNLGLDPAAYLAAAAEQAVLNPEQPLLPTDFAARMAAEAEAEAARA